MAGIIVSEGGADLNLFRSLPPEVLAASTWKLGDGSIFAMPAFSLPKASWAAVAAIMPIAIATIPESTAHVYQLDIYVNNLAEQKGKKMNYSLADMLDMNLIGDGICDMISGVVGGPAGTNYGEYKHNGHYKGVFRTCTAGFRNNCNGNFLLYSSD